MTPIWYHRILFGGESGRDVDIIQRKVGASPTGVFDEQTQQFIRGIQAAALHAPTGIIDPDTAELLGEAADHSLPPEWFRRDLHLGMEGDDVSALRVALGQPSGHLFDEPTRQAVLRFQSAHALPLTGTVNLSMSLTLP